MPHVIYFHNAIIKFLDKFGVEINIHSEDPLLNIGIISD